MHSDFYFVRITHPNKKVQCSNLWLWPKKNKKAKLHKKWILTIVTLPIWLLYSSREQRCAICLWCTISEGDINIVKTHVVIQQLFVSFVTECWSVLEAIDPYLVPVWNWIGKEIDRIGFDFWSNVWYRQAALGASEKAAEMHGGYLEKWFHLKICKATGQMFCSFMATVAELTAVA